jgi:putative PIN family toxin of toxin-antitoxin system
MASARVILDTNVLISRLLLPESVAGRAVRRVLDRVPPLVSEPTLGELAQTLSKPKFDRYVSIKDRRRFFELFARVAEWVTVTSTIRVCRDATRCQTRRCIRPPVRMAFAKFWAPVPWMLEAAIALELILGKYVEATIIALLLIFNALLGFFQESRAQATLAALKSRLALNASVRRDNVWKRCRRPISFPETW